MSRAAERCAAFRHDRLASIREGVAADIRRYLTKSPENIAAGDGLKHQLGALFTPQLLALLGYRISHWLAVNRWHRISRVVARMNFHVHRVSIPPLSCIGPGCLLPHPAGVTFCGSAGSGLTVYSMAICCPAVPFADHAAAASPFIGDGVSVGGHALVLGAVSIGDGARIGFCANVDHDVPGGALVMSRAHRLRLRADAPSGRPLASAH